MAVSYEQALEMKRRLEEDYRDRHEAHRQLRNYWHGRYWKEANTQAAGSIGSVFKDLTSRSSDVGPDVKLVNNVVQQVCVKFQTFLGPLPMINVYVDPPETNNRRAQATKKERALYGTWGEVQMGRITNKMGWYLPLMGDCFLGIRPDFERNVPVPILRSPECAYPVPSADGMSLGAVVFSWEIPQSVAMRDFPNYKPMDKARPGVMRNLLPTGFPFRGQTSQQSSDPKVQCLEYSDGNEWHQWLDGQEVHGVVHNFGFNLFEQVQFINVPDEPWGHGAVEQAVNMNEMGNALYSLLFQSVLENVFPRLVLIDPSKAPEEIDMGPGAVIPINAGGNVAWLHPPVQALGSQMGFISQNENAIRSASGMSKTDFGESPASSVVTGKAISELQGASSGSTIEMVQNYGIGAALEGWNEKALFMYQTLFREESIKLGGIRPRSIADLKGQMFSLTFKGSEIVGSQRNELTFSPALSMHEKIVMGLQMAGGGLVSKKYQRSQVGIPDSEAMDEEIIGEAIEEAVVGAVLQELQAAPTPQTADQAEREAYAYLSGATVAPPSAQQPQAPAALPAGPPTGQPGPPAPLPGGPPPPGGVPGVPPGQAPGNAPPPGPSLVAQPQPTQGTQTVTLQQATAAFEAVQGVTGRVFLVGEIADRGQTDSDIEVAITEPDDRQTLTQGMPDYTGRLVFHMISGEPQEKFVEVTPGSTPGIGGSQKPNPQNLQGVFVG